jgi:hypothetical protein
MYLKPITCYDILTHSCVFCSQIVKEESRYIEMFRKAHELGYHVIIAEQSHAEGQLIQYLYSRSHKYRLTPVDAGWSRNVCCICWDLFEALWGPDVFKKFSRPPTKRDMREEWEGSMKWYFPPALTEAIDFFMSQSVSTEATALKNWLRKFREHRFYSQIALRPAREDPTQLEMWMSQKLSSDPLPTTLICQ